MRVHANLWETHYLRPLALIVVDHPPGTEIYVDERFFLDADARRKLYLTGPPRPVARAWDHNGQDVDRRGAGPSTAAISTVPAAGVQGVTDDHWVEVDLGDDAPTTGPVCLLAHGWIHPTDSSINVALEQGTTIRPHGLVLEVPDGKGGWKVGRAGPGLPRRQEQDDA